MSTYPKQNILNSDSNDLTSISSECAHLFSKNTKKNERKPLGQFFTPQEIARYMANCIDISGDRVSILDPCAGTGTLIAAFCDKIAKEMDHSINIFINAYEIDSKLIPYLESSMSFCKEILELNGHIVDYLIIEGNFIEKNAQYLNHNFPDNDQDEYLEYFDIVLSNPPYYKLKRDCKEYEIMNGFLNGQPNIYSSFVILATKMLKNSGQFVHIIPRSFCSGLYYKNIRNWLLENSCIYGIHNFKSRSKIFDQQEVLQEVIIIYGGAGNAKKCKTALISSSKDKSLDDYKEVNVPYRYISHPYGEDKYIRIPTSRFEMDILDIVDSWEYTLEDFGITVSTGRIVDFRTMDNLRDDYSGDNCVPLLWAQNLNQDGINLNPKNYTKKKGIEINNETKKALVPIQNYVLLKRLTSKCNKRRIFASPFFKSQFREFEFIGFENHLNYIHGIDRGLKVKEVKGLCALLGSDIIDVYFRVMNGSTQVNANDLLKIPMPDYEVICALSNVHKSNKIMEILISESFHAENNDLWSE